MPLHVANHKELEVNFISKTKESASPCGVLILIHFFLSLNRKLKATVKGFNLLGNDFTESGFRNFSSAIEVLYRRSNSVKTYCGEIVKQVYDDDLMEGLIIKVDNVGKADLNVIAHTLMLNGKCFVHLCVLLYLAIEIL